VDPVGGPPLLRAALELVLGRGRTGEERAHGVELRGLRAVRGAGDRALAVVEVVAGTSERERLERLGGRAHADGARRRSGGEEDGAVAHRDEVDEVLRLDRLPALDGYPQGIHVGEGTCPSCRRSKRYAAPWTGRCPPRRSSARARRT
jgi:hypothetical protein